MQIPFRGVCGEQSAAACHVGPVGKACCPVSGPLWVQSVDSGQHPYSASGALFRGSAPPSLSPCMAPLQSHLQEPDLAPQGPGGPP